MKRYTAEDLLEHGGWLRRLARSLVEQAAVADDVVQETWLAALRHAPARDRPLRPWLATVLRNFVRMRARGEGRRVRREDAVRVEAEIHAPSPEELLARVETQRLLAERVLALDEPYRQTVLLRYVEGLTAAEIARRLGVPAGTVRWRLKTALDRLGAGLGENDDERRKFALALLPLAERPGPGLSWTPWIEGAWTMARWQKISLGVALAVAVLVGGGVAWQRGRTTGTGAQAGTEARTETGAVAEPTPGPAPGTGAGAAPGPIRTVEARVEAAADAPAGRFEGRIINWSSGHGVEGAEVTFALGDLASTVRSGADGTFRFEPPRPGRYRLAEASAPGFLPFGPAWGHSQIELEARPGLAVRDLRVQITPALDYTGQVVFPDGRPAAGAQVRLLDVPPLAPEAAGYTADARGEFVFHAADDALLEARFPGHAPGRARLDGAATITHRLTITLGPPGDTAARGLALTGTVLDPRGEPVADARVSARALTGPLSPEPETVTDPDGRFRLEGLDPGPHEVVAEEGEHAPARREVAAGAEGVTLTLAAGARLGGRVVSAGGDPVPAFTLVVLRPRGVANQIVTSRAVIHPDGRFDVGGLAPGRYAVVATAHGRAPSSRVEVEVPGQGEVELTLGAGGTIAGRVVEAGKGKPIQYARVTVEDNQLGGGSATVPLATSTVTDADGTFELRGVAPGRRSIFVGAHRHHMRIVSGLDVAEGASVGPVTVELTATAEGETPQLEIAGIGVKVESAEDGLRIMNVVPGGGAEAAGLAAGDVIVAVEGQTVAELGMDSSLQRIRGPEGTQVRLRVRRQGAGDLDVVATRRKIRA